MKSLSVWLSCLLLALFACGCPAGDRDAVGASGAHVGSPALALLFSQASAGCRPADAAALMRCDIWLAGVESLPSKDVSLSGALQTVASAFSASDPYLIVAGDVALRHLLLPRLRRCIERQDSESPPIRADEECLITASSSRKLISAIGKLRVAVERGVLTAAVMSALLGEQLKPYVTMLEAQADVEVRAYGYVQLIRVGKARALPIIFAMSGENDPRVLAAVLDAARNLDLSATGREALCRWSLSLMRSSRPRVLQAAGLTLIGCGDDFREQLLDNGFERLKHQRLSVPFLRVIRDICTQPSKASPAQCLRTVALLGAIAEARKTPLRLRGEAVWNLHLQRCPVEVKLSYLRRMESDPSATIRDRVHAAIEDLTANPNVPRTIRASSANP